MLPFAWPYPLNRKMDIGASPPLLSIGVKNYVISTYIAEALNTTTNSVFIALATFAIYHAFHNKLEPRFIFTAFGFLFGWCWLVVVPYDFEVPFPIIR